MNLSNITDLTEVQILNIFSLSESLKINNDSNILAGKTFILFFPTSSLRTRITFEKGIKDLGGSCILFPSDTLDKREDLRDVIQYIENWADGVIVRHSDFSKIQELSKYSSIPIVNAMTSENHPCEIISDLYSISSIKEDYRDLVYTFVGKAGNIAKSWMDIATIMNLKFNHVCFSGNELTADHRNYKFHTDLDSVLVNSDVILTDSLPEEYQTKEYIDRYQITLERMMITKKNAILNPCPPFFRNEEVTTDVISSEYFVGYLFKKNLIYVQQAILLYCCGLDGDCQKEVTCNANKTL